MLNSLAAFAVESDTKKCLKIAESSLRALRLILVEQGEHKKSQESKIKLFEAKTSSLKVHLGKG